MKGLLRIAGVLAALVGTGAVSAHHSGGMFEPTGVWIKGSFVEFQRINPHTILILEAANANGPIQRWAVDGVSVPQLERQGLTEDFLNEFLHVGDRIELCVFPLKAEFSSAPEGAPPFVHGKVIKLEDGTMRMWGPYGAIVQCVQPNDELELWLDFLNTQPPARTAWCRRFVNPLPQPPGTTELIEEISARMASPCD